MKRVQAETERVVERCRRTAELSCEFFDSLSSSPITPQRFDEVQESIRRSLLFVEERLRALATRPKRRRARLKRLCGEQEGFSRFVGELSSLFRGREAALDYERRLLKQTADVLAWIALDFEPNVIASLYLKAEHRLPVELGLAGVTVVAREGHRSGKFLFVENDLTRCVGLGDLTVVPFARKWSQPLSLEIKTTGEYREGGSVEVNIHAVKVEGTDQSELLADLQATLGFKDAAGPSLEASHPRQAEKMMSRGKYLYELSHTNIKRIEEPDKARWAKVSDLLESARQSGIGIDRMEPGVTRVALARTGSKALTPVDLPMLLTDLGTSPEFEASGSIDFQNDASVSAMIRPIATWPLSVQDRVALLVGDIELTTIVDPKVWQKAFAASDLILNDGSPEYGWAVTRPDGKGAVLPRLAAERLRLGVFYEGISPSSTAATIKRALDEEPDRTRGSDDSSH